MNAADGTNATRLTYNPALDEQSSWSPDGEKIAFTRTEMATLKSMS